MEARLQAKQGDAGIALALARFPCSFSLPTELESSWLMLGTCSAVTDLGKVCKLSQEGAQS